MITLTLVISGLILYLIIFAIYLETSPNLKNIWIRIGADNKKYINLSSLYNFIIQPFYMKELWEPRFWDINYFVGSIITIFILNLFA
jgi:hypothetical protein